MLTLNSLKVGKWHPTNIVANMDTTPVTYRFGDLYFGTFVNGK